MGYARTKAHKVTQWIAKGREMHRFKYTWEGKVNKEEGKLGLGRQSHLWERQEVWSKIRHMTMENRFVPILSTCDWYKMQPTKNKNIFLGNGSYSFKHFNRVPCWIEIQCKNNILDIVKRYPTIIFKYIIQCSTANRQINSYSLIYFTWSQYCKLVVHLYNMFSWLCCY